MTVREAVEKLLELGEPFMDQELVVTLSNNTTVPLENVRVGSGLRNPFWNYKENRPQ